MPTCRKPQGPCTPRQPPAKPFCSFPPCGEMPNFKKPAGGAAIHQVFISLHRENGTDVLGAASDHPQRLRKTAPRLAPNSFVQLQMQTVQLYLPLRRMDVPLFAISKRVEQFLMGREKPFGLILPHAAARRGSHEGAEGSWVRGWYMALLRGGW